MHDVLKPGSGVNATVRSGWLLYTLLLVIFWGVWGAFSSLPADLFRYPSEMIYIVWAFTMLVPCFFVIRRQAFDRRRVAFIYGMLIGLTGAGGQLLLFKALTIGPAYLIFPIVATSPSITVIAAFVLLRERIGGLGWIGVILALAAIVMFSIPDQADRALSVGWWLPLAVIVAGCWGVQAFFMKCAATSQVPDATTFAYMTISGLLLVPLAYWSIAGGAFGYSWKAPALTAAIQLLNAVGALFLVMAMSRGKAIVVAPATNALAPVLTVLISLAVDRAIPTTWAILGIVLALVGSTMIVYADARTGSPASAT